MAQRPILLRDSGKIARTSPAASLKLELEEKRSAGLAWRVQRMQGPAHVERDANLDEAAPRARFSVRFSRPGLVELAFLEGEPEGSIYSHASSRAPTYESREMTLTVIVES